MHVLMVSSAGARHEQFVSIYLRHFRCCPLRCCRPIRRTAIRFPSPKSPTTTQLVPVLCMVVGGSGKGGLENFFTAATAIGSSRRTNFKSENFSCSWWEVILFIPPGKIIMFSSKISHFWAENTFFLILFSRREWVGNTYQYIFPVLLVQLSPNF